MFNGSESQIPGLTSADKCTVARHVSRLSANIEMFIATNLYITLKRGGAGDGLYIGHISKERNGGDRICNIRPKSALES